MRPAAERFARVLKTRDVLILAFGAMIGWNWVLMTGYWVGYGRRSFRQRALVPGSERAESLQQSQDPD